MSEKTIPDVAKLISATSNFRTDAPVIDIAPFGNGWINDSFLAQTADPKTTDYVLQRINHNIFRDVDLLQTNIEAVTAHIHKKLTEQGAADIERKVLRFIPSATGKTYHFDGQSYWRMMVFIPRSTSHEAVTAESSRLAGLAFGDFQNLLSDIPTELGETIPNFHNMEFRLGQLRQAIADDAAGRLSEVADIVAELELRAEYMCSAERLHREGKLPKRICHCDTKVNNILFDNQTDEILCVVDLDTVMPSFIFSDFGDFMRTAANKGEEDDLNLDRVEFSMEIFKAFTEGYLTSARPFLTKLEIENLPYAAALFPYMQTVRFLTDYLNGDTYYKILRPAHNLDRTKAQFKLLQSVEHNTPQMKEFIDQCLK